MTDRRQVLKGGVGIAAASLLAPVSFGGVAAVASPMAMLMDPRFLGAREAGEEMARLGTPVFWLDRDRDIAELWLGDMRDAARAGGISGLTLYSAMMISEVFGREIGLRPWGAPRPSPTKLVGGSGKADMLCWSLMRPEGGR